MEIMEYLNSLLVSENIEEHEFAEKFLTYKNLYETGKITREEYFELKNDLLELKTINTEMLSIDAQKRLMDIIAILKTLKVLLSF